MKKKPFILSSLIIGIFGLSSCVSGGKQSSSNSSSNSSSPLSSSASSSESSSSSTSSSSESSSSSSSASSSSSSSSSSSYNPNNLYQPKEGDYFACYALEMKGAYGDATIFKYGDFEILVDGGPAESATIVKDALKEYVTDGVLDMLILTHPHMDHYGGFPMSTFTGASISSVRYIIDSGADTYGVTYVNQWVNGVRKPFITKGAKYYAVKTLTDESSPYTMPITDDISISFLDTGNYTTPGGNGKTSDPNVNSVTFSLRAGSYSFFMMGDLPNAGCDGLMAKNPDVTKFIPEGDTIVFKAGHHGSDGSNGQTFIDYLKPDYAWCSSAILEANQVAPLSGTSQHPYRGARHIIESSTGTENIYWNGTMGTIDMSLDENFEDFIIEGEGRKAAPYYYDGKVVDSDSEADTPLEDTVWSKYCLL